MKINLHIDRVVLDGIPIAGSQRSVLQTALATELTQSLKSDFGSQGRMRHFHTDCLAGGQIRVESVEAARIGAQLARAVHGAFTK